MARYTGARLRITRRLGALPGLTAKWRSKRRGGPGQHGATGQGGKGGRKVSDYSTRLREKQRLRFHYGVSEKQLVGYVSRAKKHKRTTGDVLLQLLEMRLDNVIYRLGLAPTIVAARQIVSHRHIFVNKFCISIPSYQCKPGDILTIRESPASEGLIRTNVEERLALSSGALLQGHAVTRHLRELSRGAPRHLLWDERVLFMADRGQRDRRGSLERRVVDGFSGNLIKVRVRGLSSRGSVGIDINELLVVEYYSRKV
jgi:small subunit ribosomal protein S4